jgi:hypothetical protein
MKSNHTLNRRQMLRLSAGTLLTLGLWPGALRAQGAGSPGSFRFVVVNDIHFMTDRCRPWLERVVDKIKAGPKPETCLLVGDQSDHGTTAEMTQVKEAFDRLEVPAYTVIGNHDYLSQTDRADYEKSCPDRLNYHFEHRGWLFMGLDTTEGLKSGRTKIHDATLKWLNDNLPKLNKTAPLVLFTHFPLGERVTNRPLNADAVLERLREHNLQAVFNGHYHAFTERHVGQTTLVTNRCCSVSKSNHDQSKEKGYFLCEARDGKVVREFVEVETTGLTAPAPSEGRPKPETPK